MAPCSHATNDSPTHPPTHRYNDLPVELNPSASIEGFTVKSGDGKAIVNTFSTGTFSALVLELYVHASSNAPRSLAGRTSGLARTRNASHSHPPSHLTSPLYPPRREIKRDPKFHVFSVLLPACLFVVCCYLSFWIDRKVRRWWHWWRWWRWWHQRPLSL